MAAEEEAHFIRDPWYQIPSSNLVRRSSTESHFKKFLAFSGHSYSRVLTVAWWYLALLGFEIDLVWEGLESAPRRVASNNRLLPFHGSLRPILRWFSLSAMAEIVPERVSPGRVDLKLDAFGRRRPGFTGQRKRLKTKKRIKETYRTLVSLGVLVFL
ncbi:hypothetical protein BDV24DRAFT_84578 [Aspergillus arachidicola]|uniref:Uncharacterized protein n=1 Tax=Aspergillus arachidicola TaxID=656916 RepID=A0A5N6Y2R6_9EURO|nr:hypothetical protein BDV24DRAFT_84578 [Aspergillus arachidicola]